MGRKKKAKTFAEILRREREARGLNQSQLARKIGLLPSIVSHYETGARNPNYEHLKKLAKALKISADILLGLRERNLGDLAREAIDKDLDDNSGFNAKFSSTWVSQLFNIETTLKGNSGTFVITIDVFNTKSDSWRIDENG